MKPFLHGRATLSHETLRVPPGFLSPLGRVVEADRPPTPACDSGAPTVETVKEGGKVVRLMITCRCGERIEIDCLYQSATGA